MNFFFWTNVALKFLNAVIFLLQKCCFNIFGCSNFLCWSGWYWLEEADLCRTKGSIKENQWTPGRSNTENGRTRKMVGPPFQQNFGEKKSHELMICSKDWRCEKDEVSWVFVSILSSWTWFFFFIKSFFLTVYGYFTSCWENINLNSYIFDIAS